MSPERDVAEVRHTLWLYNANMNGLLILRSHPAFGDLKQLIGLLPAIAMQYPI